MSVQSLVNIELAILIGTLITAYISSLIYGIATCKVDNVAVDVSDKPNQTGGSIY